MIEHAQGVVASHPEFAFGHSVLAEAYAEAAGSIDVPDRAQAMNDAARREANLTLKLDPEDAGAYAVLSGLETRYRLPRARSDFAARHKIREAPQSSRSAHYIHMRHIAQQCRASARSPFLPVDRASHRQMGCTKNGQGCARLCQHGKLARSESLDPEGRSSAGPTIRASERTQLYIAGFYEQPADALAIFDACMRRRSPDDEQNAIWRTFVEAKAAHSAQLTGVTIREDPRGRRPGRNLARDRDHDVGGAWRNQAGHRGRKSRARSSTALEPWFLFTPVTRNVRQDPGFVRLWPRAWASSNIGARPGKRPDFCTDRASRGECSPQLLAAIKSN